MSPRAIVTAGVVLALACAGDRAFAARAGGHPTPANAPAAAPAAPDAPPAPDTAPGAEKLDRDGFRLAVPPYAFLSDTRIKVG